jgi:hypothetical protein
MEEINKNIDDHIENIKTVKSKNTNKKIEDMKARNFETARNLQDQTFRYLFEKIQQETNATENTRGDRKMILFCDQVEALIARVDDFNEKMFSRTKETTYCFLDTTGIKGSKIHVTEDMNKKTRYSS